MKRLVSLMLAAAVALSVSMSALGQQSKSRVIGKLKDVQGLVTVSDGERLSTAVTDAPLISGSRIITTSSGAVRLNFDIGCDVTLKPNEAITVKDGLNCAALLASVQPVGGPGLAIAAAGGGAVAPVLIIAGGAVAAVIVTRDRNNVSGR